MKLADLLPAEKCYISGTYRPHSPHHMSVPGISEDSSLIVAVIQQEPTAEVSACEGVGLVLREHKGPAAWLTSGWAPRAPSLLAGPTSLATGGRSRTKIWMLSYRCRPQNCTVYLLHHLVFVQTANKTLVALLGKPQISLCSYSILLYIQRSMQRRLQELGYPWVMRKAMTKYGSKSTDLIKTKGATMKIVSVNAKGAWTRILDTEKSVHQVFLSSSGTEVLSRH